MLAECAVYERGVRRDGLALADAIAAGRRPGSFVWIELETPTDAELDTVRAEFDLHPLAVEDALTAHQRPKLEVYGDDLFLVVKAARYVEERETVELGEVQLFVGADYVVTVRHGSVLSLAAVREAVEQDRQRLERGPIAVVHAVLDEVVDGYAPVIEGLDNDISEIEVEVFDADRPRSADPSQRIFKLKREVLDLHRQTEPLVEVLDRLETGDVPHVTGALSEYFRDVHDHLLRVVAEIEKFSALLSDSLSANLSQVQVRQNADMRTISAVVALAAVPTVVGAVYGMNFEHMPELGWRFGYPAVLALTALVCVVLYVRFKRSGWL
jgi:magnesium transporter